MNQKRHWSFHDLRRTLHVRQSPHQLPSNWQWKSLHTDLHVAWARIFCDSQLRHFNLAAFLVGQISTQYSTKFHESPRSKHSSRHCPREARARCWEWERKSELPTDRPNRHDNLILIDFDLKLPRKPQKLSLHSDHHARFQGPFTISKSTICDATTRFKRPFTISKSAIFDETTWF